MGEGHLTHSVDPCLAGRGERVRRCGGFAGAANFLRCAMPCRQRQEDALSLSILAICVGASLGALLRWLLSSRLNSMLPSLPPGTLVANLVGGYLIGVAVAFFASHPSLSPQWRLLVVTGFLGGLTTFSTFSAEVVTNLMEARLSWAFATVAAHLLGSLAMTLLGIGTVQFFRAMQS
ncbi:fluoride efflux transporter CrcB [Variovorax sp. M-6]|uniref:fluoride efflux transporter CrcB n=1 Tax=Variovorax sp. M-6 TaxID=3233041 RepID=UPI003F970AC8